MDLLNRVSRRAFLASPFPRLSRRLLFHTGIRSRVASYIAASSRSIVSGQFPRVRSEARMHAYVCKFVGTTGASVPPHPSSRDAGSLVRISVSFSLPFLSPFSLLVSFSLQGRPFLPLFPPRNPALDLPLAAAAAAAAVVVAESPSDSDRQSELDRRSEWIVQRGTSHESPSAAGAPSGSGSAPFARGGASLFFIERVASRSHPRDLEDRRIFCLIGKSEIHGESARFCGRNRGK